MNVYYKVVPTFIIVCVIVRVKKWNNKHEKNDSNNDLFDCQIWKNFTDFTFFLAHLIHKIAIKNEFFLLVASFFIIKLGFFEITHVWFLNVLIWFLNISTWFSNISTWFLKIILRFSQVIAFVSNFQ